MNAPAGIDVNESAHAIVVRDRRFGREAQQERWWAGGDPVATAWFNALSATFPRGEALFVDAVKAFRADAPPRLAAEIGDLLFAVANLARYVRVDPERELRTTVARFRSRFQHIEDQLKERGSHPTRATLAEMDALWEEAKALEKENS